MEFGKTSEPNHHFQGPAVKSTGFVNHRKKNAAPLNQDLLVGGNFLRQTRLRNHCSVVQPRTINGLINKWVTRAVTRIKWIFSKETTLDLTVFLVGNLTPQFYANMNKFAITI